MKFHGRLTPGRVVELDTVVELRLHAPARASGVTVKLWELDTFLDADGRPRSEGSADDLLAVFTGDLTPSSEATPRASDWRAFKISSSTISAADPEVLRFRFRLPGTDEIFNIPLLSEADEVEGDDFELGFSLEVGGAEVFRSKAPTLITPPKVSLRAVEATFGVHGEDHKPDPSSVSEAPVALRFVAIGRPIGDPAALDAKLWVLGNGHLDAHGHLVGHPEERSDGTGATLIKQVRGGRPLYLFVHDDPEPLPIGVSTIPLALCEPISREGLARVERMDRSHPSGAQVLEHARSRDDREDRLRFDRQPQETEAPRRYDAERARAAVARIAQRFRGASRDDT
ncbi:MAG: hypothetical protein R3B48_30650 [Kofleriaceae bacterium]